MEALLLFGRFIASFAIDCAVTISAAALAALLATHFLGSRQPARAFAVIAAAFGLAAVLLCARGHMRLDGEPLDPPPAAERHGPLASQDEPSSAPALTVIPGLTARYGSMFQIRFARRAAEGPVALGAANTTPWIPVLGLTWSAGFLVVLLPRLLGLGVVSRIVSRSDACADRRLLHAAERAREILDARRAELRLSAGSGAACTTGLCRPCILLPVSALDWPEARLASTLLHEYMHVKRCDVPLAEGLHLLASLAWFSPFPWLALSAALRLREEACDEAVLHAGVPCKAYATDLLAAARSLAPRPTAAARLSSHSHLEDRLRAILADPVLPARRQQVMRTGAAAGLVAAMIGLVRLAAPFYAIPEFGPSETLPQNPGEWAAAGSSLEGRGAFSLAQAGDYTWIRLRFRGRASTVQIPSGVLPSAFPLTSRARLIVPFGELVDATSRRPFVNPGWSIWDDRQTAIRAAAPGRVRAIHFEPGRGPVIDVDHGEGLNTRYGLGRCGTSSVVPGEFVLAGTPVGTFGACSPYDLPSLSFSIFLDVRGEQVALDPAPFLFGSAENRTAPLGASLVNAAIRLDDRAELRRLIALGLPLNQPSGDGTLPLEWALLNQNLPIAQELVAAGADPRTPTWDVHQAHIALHGPTIAALARDTADPAMAALLAPE